MRPIMGRPPSPAHNRPVVATGPELDVVVHDGQGPFAMLVHGILASRATWLRNLEGLGAVCRPVTVNLWGHGGAPTPDDPRAYHPAAYVAALDALRRDLCNADGVIVIGQSMGAGLVLRYALDHPEHVIAAVATNSMSGFADAATAKRLEAMTRRGALQMEEAGPAALDQHTLHPSRSRKLDAEQQAALLADWQRHDPVGVARTMRYTVPALPVRDLLPGLVPPALLVNGLREQEFQPVAAALRDELPQWSHVDLDGGHMINQHDPGGFVAAVTEFLARVG